MSWRRAPRSSTNSAPCTWRPVTRSSTPRPTACSRSRRTKASFPCRQLYKWCNVAYDLAVKGLGLGRVIARPFIGLPGSFQRTANRHDYAMPPVADTLLDRMLAAGQHVASVGKISDLFAGRGISESHPTASDAEGVDQVDGADGDAAQRPDLRQPGGLRHRSTGIATTRSATPRNLEQFDARLPRLVAKLRDDDLLVLTADHGNDPTTPSTDHSREHVPVLLHGRQVESRRRSRDALDLRRSWPDAGGDLRCAVPCRTAPAFWRHIKGRR